MLHTLNTYNFISQLYLSKGGEKVDTASRQKISKDIDDLNDRINQLDLIDIDKPLSPSPCPPTPTSRIHIKNTGRI